MKLHSIIEIRCVLIQHTKASKDEKPQVQNELKRKREDSSEDESVPKQKNPIENPSKVGTVTIHVYMYIHCTCACTL